MSLGATVKNQRERRGWTQQDVALRVGVPQQSIDQLENNRVSQPRYLAKLAEVFGLTIYALYAIAEGREQTPAAAGCPNIESLNKEFFEITPHEAAVLAATLRAIRAKEPSG